MKKLLSCPFFALILLVILCNPSFAQTLAVKPVAKMISDSRTANIQFKNSTPFVLNASPVFKINTDAFAKNITYAKLDLLQINSLHKTKNAALELSIPYKNNILSLELIEVNIFADGFKISTDITNDEAINYQPGVYYQGIVKDDPNSIVAISIFEDEIMGIVSSTAEGNINIGRYFKGEKNDYLIFSDRDILVENNNSGCATIEDESYLDQFHEIMEMEGSSRITACPKIYFEADYGLYQNKGSVTNTVNYVTGIYNNSAVIYTNELVPTQISEIFVWTTNDGYSAASSYEALSDFKANRTTFNGDIAHLLALDPGGLGGVASTINGLCNSYKYCYSDIDASYSDFPTYSWTVMVVTHEMGHLFGSYHTHNCSAWIGGALDNCYTTEGGCAQGPPPVGGGTIMSYCHITGYGINFNNGFGLLPGNAIRNTISAAACISSCDGTPSYCATVGLSTANEWIQTINIAGTNNNSGNNGGYGDFTATIINLTSGGTASFTLTPGFSGIMYPQYFSIWIDHNKDLDFTDVGENVYNSVAVTGAVSGSFSVPAGLTGTTRMRITMKYNALATSCETFDKGEVEDYTVSFTPAGDTYCTSAGTSSIPRHIDYINIGTISRTSGSDGGYYDGTALSTNVSKGGTYSLKYSAGFSGTVYQMYWRAWIDYNDDGDFTDAGEQILQKTATSSGIIKKNIKIPLTASTGLKRMRISSKYGGYPTSCETFSDGEVEDYTINILPGLIFEEENTFSLNIYPNPSNGIYQLEYINAINGGINIEVFDIIGNKILIDNVQEEQGVISLDITNVAPGLYLIKATLSNGETIIKQVIKN